MEKRAAGHGGSFFDKKTVSLRDELCACGAFGDSPPPGR